MSVLRIGKNAQQPFADIGNIAVRTIQKMLTDALHARASDVHFEPAAECFRLRYRIDGLLHTVKNLPKLSAHPLLIRLKVMSRLDISEQRLPQDGGCQLTTASHPPTDLRVSTCPTIYGEKIVVRLLPRDDAQLALERLGLNSQQYQQFDHALQQPQGMILVTGPTGSGKTVTLYSAIKRLNQSEKNLCTVEDPVEIKLAGINQTQINPKAGLYFSTVLRSLLRQDPDIIMIGEIRDAETAEIAFKAAQTGHLVLATLHTNSALATITRLQQLNISLNDMSHAIHLIMAQRLVRKLCQHCQAGHQNQTVTGSECTQCRDGYRGRVGVFECLTMTEKLIHALQNNNYSTVNFLQLKAAGLQTVKAGLTTVAELNRVLGC